jgi:CheY-like chemotaxis protein
LVKFSVLVVDDDPIQRAIICEVLQPAYDCREAEDGEDGLRRLEEGPADLVIVDMLMPEKDGIETIGAIRARWPSTRIIAISGGGTSLPSRYLLDTAKAVGADAVMDKPLSRQALPVLVAEVLADGRGADLP